MIFCAILVTSNAASSSSLGIDPKSKLRKTAETRSVFELVHHCRLRQRRLTFGKITANVADERKLRFLPRKRKINQLVELLVASREAAAT